VSGVQLVSDTPEKRDALVRLAALPDGWVDDALTLAVVEQATAVGDRRQVLEVLEAAYAGVRAARDARDFTALSTALADEAIAERMEALFPAVGPVSGVQHVQVAAGAVVGAVDAVGARVALRCALETAAWASAPATWRLTARGPFLRPTDDELVADIAAESEKFESLRSQVASLGADESRNSDVLHWLEVAESLYWQAGEFGRERVLLNERIDRVNRERSGAGLDWTPDGSIRWETAALSALLRFNAAQFEAVA